MGAPIDAAGRAASESRPRARVEGIDIARGVASLVMLQGHAYHGWVAAEHHSSPAYQLTRVLGTLPLPAFLLLSGAAVASRTLLAVERGEGAAALRRRVIVRGFQILLVGYLVSFASALLDGADGLGTLLRADVLHVIGLGIALLAWLGIRPTAGRHLPDPRRLLVFALGAGLLITLAGPWLSRLGLEARGPLRYALALLLDIPGISRMPLVPLFAWTCAGAVLALGMARSRRARPSPFAASAGASPRFLWLLLAAGLVLATLGSLGASALLETLGGSFDRRHPAVILNVVELTGRGLFLLAASALLAPRLWGWPRVFLLRLGRGSLVIYIVHIPFCYGALAGPARATLGMGEASALLLPLIALSFAALLGYEAAKGRLLGLQRRRRARAEGPRARLRGV